MPLRKNAKVELIRKVPLFSQCSRREVAEIAMLADEIDLSEGKTMIREGERGREFFVLLDGTAEVRKRNRKIGTLQGGDFFGEIALVSNAPRTATVTTTSPVRTLVVTDRSFQRLMEGSPQIQLKVLQALADRLARDSL